MPKSGIVDQQRKCIINLKGFFFFFFYDLFLYLKITVTESVRERDIDREVCQPLVHSPGDHNGQC